MTVATDTGPSVPREATLAAPVSSRSHLLPASICPVLFLEYHKTKMGHYRCRRTAERFYHGVCAIAAVETGLIYPLLRSGCAGFLVLYSLRWGNDYLKENHSLVWACGSGLIGIASCCYLTAINQMPLVMIQALLIVRALIYWRQSEILRLTTRSAGWSPYVIGNTARSRRL